MSSQQRRQLGDNKITMIDQSRTHNTPRVGSMFLLSLCLTFEGYVLKLNTQTKVILDMSRQHTNIIA